MARTILAVLLLAMAILQATDPAGFVDVIETYEVGGTVVAWLLAGALFVGETIGGSLLLARPPDRRRTGAAIALATSAVWSVLAVQAFARGLPLENCGCFGVHLAQPLRWWILLEDAEFVLLAWWVHRRTVRAAGRTPVGSRTPTRI